MLYKYDNPVNNAGRRGGLSPNRPIALGYNLPPQLYCAREQWRWESRSGRRCFSKKTVSLQDFTFISPSGNLYIEIECVKKKRGSFAMLPTLIESFLDFGFCFVTFPFALEFKRAETTASLQS